MAVWGLYGAQRHVTCGHNWLPPSPPGRLCGDERSRRGRRAEAWAGRRACLAGLVCIVCAWQG